MLSHLFRSLPLILALLCTPLLYAQPLVDGISIGIGLSSYHGDLDWNPDNGPAEFLAAGNIGLFVAADRAFGPIVTEGALQYNRIGIDFPGAEMAINMISLDFTAGPSFNLFRSNFLRLYAGISPTLLLTNYSDVSELDRLDSNYDFDERSSRVLVTFPIGLVVQDVFRVGLRITPTDNFDSVTGLTEDIDLVSSIHIGYRFDLLR